MKPAPIHHPPALIEQAIDKLRDARELLKAAQAPRTVARVRLALTSAQGALRHAQNGPARAERRRDV